MIQFEHLKFSDCKIMPWKNGNGMTREIKIFPKNSSINQNDFLWRLSSAEVRDSGLFSAFPGYQRFLSVLDGKGLELSFENNKTEPLININTSNFAEFSGDEQIFCHLLGDKVVDLNFIYRRDKICASFEILKSSLNNFTIYCESSDVCILFVMAGQIDILNLSSVIQLDQFDTLILNNDQFKPSMSSADISISAHKNSKYLLVKLQKR